MKMDTFFRFVMVSFLVMSAGISHAKNCSKGQPCGNSCISWSDTCHIGTPPAATKYPPTAYFTQSHSSGNAPLTVSLDATYSSSTGAVINSYQWSSSNGQTAAGKNGSIVFTDPGAYTITLTVTDSNGLTASSQKTVMVSAPPPATPVTVKCADTIYAAGRLTIPALDIPVAFGQITTYRVIMDYVALSSPPEFVLVGATIGASVGCRNATFDPSTGIIAIPTVEVAGSGQYSISLLVLSGTDPMHFKLHDTTKK